jgi:hypothetical protein
MDQSRNQPDGGQGMFHEPVLGIMTFQNRPGGKAKAPWSNV